MSITIHEKWESRRSTVGDTPSAELVYIVRGTDDDREAQQALVAYTPIVYDGLVRQLVQIERVAEDIWEGTVRYGAVQRPETGSSRFEFDTGGGTQHITQSMRTVGRYATAWRVAPDFGGAIGVTHGRVEGVDITVPVFHFSETHYIPSERVTGQYRAALYYLTGAVNDRPFRGFDRGEVKFLGAAGSKRGAEDWEITFRFAASPNMTDLRIGDISGISKRGWEYLWVWYEETEDPRARVLIPRPIAVYVEQVCPYGDFSALGIGT